MTSRLQSGQVAFSPRARLLKLIGAELISDEVVAITELVKNAHDADASSVSIEFSGVTASGGEILIRDDGMGINLDTLLTRWMQPAGSAKGRAGTRYTSGGRRVLGEKGVGRFAADKLAARLELVSRTKREPLEIRMLFDWDEFDGDEKMLSDVRSRWELRKPEWLEAHGTVLRLSGLRARWTERMFHRLSTRLSRLVSPFSSDAKFGIRIESDEFPEYAGDVTGGYLDSAPYQVDAEFDGDGKVAVRINGGRALRRPWSGDAQLTCGPVRVRLYAFDLETEALAKIGPRTEVRAWLREWSGISLYRDAFRVWPYGEPSDDWLRLDQRRVNNPVVRLSNNQIVGFVEVSADKNPELRDQTNREGLIHNAAFADLQRFILSCMQLLEAERQSLRHPGGKKKDRRLARSSADPELTSLPALLEKLAEKVGAPAAADLHRAATKARSQLAAQEASRRRMLDGYADLAGLAQMATTMGKAVEITLADAHRRSTELRASITRHGTTDNHALRESLAELEHVLADAVARLSVVTCTPAGPGKRRRGLDLAAELDRIRDLLLPLLEQSRARLDIECEKGAVLRTEMRPESFATIVNALVRNSLEWASALRPPRLVISARQVAEGVELVFSDNGKGVAHAVERKLFEPGVSGHDGGAGMGLTIARNVVIGHGGTISFVSDRRRRTGATFRILLSRKRSRAT